MDNTAEEIVNSTGDLSSPLKSGNCLEEHHFGFIFSCFTTALCFFLGIPAHSWCLWFYFCTGQKIKETQLFFLNHTIMELVYCLECGIEILNTLIFKHHITECVLDFFFGLCWTGRPLIQTCICIEQYLAVIYPVTFLRYKGLKYRTVSAVAIWLMASAYGVYNATTFIFPNYIYTFVFIIALSVISFCCVSVLCALKHPGPGDTHITKQTSRDGRNQQKRNAFNTIFSAQLLIVFNYFPQVLLWLLFECDFNLFMTSLNDFGVIITPCLKMYKKGHIKVFQLFKVTQLEEFARALNILR